MTLNYFALRQKVKEKDENITISDKIVIFCNTNDIQIVNDLLIIPEKSFVALASKSP